MPDFTITLCRIEALKLAGSESMYEVINDIKNGDHAIITGTNMATARYLCHLYNLKTNKAYEISKSIPGYGQRELTIRIIRPEHERAINEIIRYAILSNTLDDQ